MPIVLAIGEKISDAERMKTRVVLPRGRPRKVSASVKERYQSALYTPLTPELAKAKNPRLIFNPDHQRVLMFEVHHALTRGLSVPEVATLLDVSATRIEQLRDKARMLDAFTFDLQTQEYVAKRFWVSCEERVKKLWDLFERSRNGHVKVKCIALVHVIEQDMVKMGQSLGLIGKFDGAHDEDMAAKARALLERYHNAVVVNAQSIVEEKTNGV